MQPAFGHATRNKRDVVALQPGINKKTVCEIYDAVRKKMIRPLSALARTDRVITMSICLSTRIPSPL